MTNGVYYPSQEVYSGNPFPFFSRSYITTSRYIYRVAIRSFLYVYSDTYQERFLPEYKGKIQ